MLDDEFEVLCAKDAEEAEKFLEGDMVQVILCDQRMPGSPASISCAAFAISGPIRCA